MVDTVSAFQRGLERPLILWLISKGPMHGYEIIKEVTRLTGRRVKPATLYPLLNRLEAEGFLVSELIEKNRRELRCYRLTEKGKNFLAKMFDLFKLPIRRVIADLLGERELNLPTEDLPDEKKNNN
jgi:DNA-binding PadR family transcriptional regulator